MDLDRDRKSQIQALDETASFQQAKLMLEQYVQIKRIFINFSIKENKKNIVSTDNMVNVIDEMRRERKVLMVIRDDKVDEYINLDMTEVDVIKGAEDDTLDLDI